VISTSAQALAILSPYPLVRPHRRLADFPRIDLDHAAATFDPAAIDHDAIDIGGLAMLDELIRRICIGHRQHVEVGCPHHHDVGAFARRQGANRVLEPQDARTVDCRQLKHLRWHHQAIGRIIGILGSKDILVEAGTCLLGDPRGVHHRAHGGKWIDPSLAAA
jgi:hypothetical protein